MCIHVRTSHFLPKRKFNHPQTHYGYYTYTLAARTDCDLRYKIVAFCVQVLWDEGSAFHMFVVWRLRGMETIVTCRLFGSRLHVARMLYMYATKDIIPQIRSQFCLYLHVWVINVQGTRTQRKTLYEMQLTHAPTVTFWLHLQLTFMHTRK